MGKAEPAQQEQLRQISQAELIAQPAQDHLEHNICRKLEEVEASARALVELAVAPATAEDRIAEVRRLSESLGLAGTAVGTRHERKLASQDTELVSNASHGVS